MASPEQSSDYDKSTNASIASDVSVQNMPKENNHAGAHSHGHVLVPESVYDIDEETRMGPENTNDAVSLQPTSSADAKALNEQVNINKNEVEPAAAPAQEEKVQAKKPTVGSSFSALSFIAAEYAESDNSSPRSTDSPMAEESNAYTVSEDVTNQSSNGFVASANFTAVAPAVEDMKDNLDTQSMSLDEEGSASKPISLPGETGAMLAGVTEVMAEEKENTHSREVKAAEAGDQSGAEPSLRGDAQQTPDLPADANGIPTVQPEPMEMDDGKIEDKNEALNTEALIISSLKDNQDTSMSMTNMSEDFKQVSNLDSRSSLGQEEYLEPRAPIIKCPIPFGENANSSMPVMGEKSILEGDNSNFSFIDESSQSNSLIDKPSRPKRPRRSSVTEIQDSKADNDDILQAFPAERVFEYQWPQDGGEWYLLQEQVCEYLAVLSFKRKYPDLTRRTCDKLEKEFLRERGVVTETQSDLGLTAVRSDEVYDLMMKDYPEKYHEYAAVLHEREKQKISEKHKEYEVAQPKLEKSKMADYMKKAAKSAAEYNRHFLRERREERVAYFDLQTFMIQYPDGRFKKLPAELTKPSSYPVALIPGQYQDHYCNYTSDELRYFPLNTAMYDPPKKMNNTLAKPAGSSESSSDDNSEDKSGSSSDSSGSGSGSSDCDTPATGAAASNGCAVTDSRLAQVVPIPATDPTVIGGKTPLKKNVRKQVKTPGKTPGKAGVKTPGKNKRKSEGGTTVTVDKGIAASTLDLPALSPPAVSKGEAVTVDDDEMDKDKCRICKNAVLFLKYKRVETKMIKCSECGKIAHPSCLDLTEKMVQVVSTYPWQCMECKTCVECMDPYDEDKMLFCDRCDRGYHTFCVGLRGLPTGRWECRSCKGVVETLKSRRGRAIKSTQ